MENLQHYLNDAFLLPVTAVGLYLVLLAAGRWFKRSAGVRWGLTYHLFGISIGLYVALRIFEPQSKLRGYVGAMAALLAAWVFIRLVERSLWEIHFQDRKKIAIPKILRDVVGLIIFLTTLLLVLSYGFDVQIPGLLAGSGVAALILGMAAQDLLANIIAGCALHFEKPFAIGDWLMLDNQYVEVKELNWRTTRCRTRDNVYLHVPNSQIARQTITNFYYPTPVHALHLHIGIDYKTPPNLVKDCLFRATASAQYVLADPRPQIWLKEFGDSSIVYDVKFWINDEKIFNEVNDNVRTNIWYELQRRQINIPFPIRTLQRAPAPPSTAPQHHATALAALRNQPLFQSLEDAHRESLLAGARPAWFGRGERIVEQGADGNSMFLLLAGDADVLVARDGPAARVAQLHAGDCFGEMSLLAGEKRTATITATTDCQILEIDRHVLAPLFEERPDFLKQLSELLARRKLATDGVLAAQTSPEKTRDKQKEYAATFLNKIQTLFEL